MIAVVSWIVLALLVACACIGFGNLLEADYKRRLAPPIEKQPRLCRTHARRLNRTGAALDITPALRRRSS